MSSLTIQVEQLPPIFQHLYTTYVPYIRDCYRNFRQNLVMDEHASASFCVFVLFSIKSKKGFDWIATMSEVEKGSVSNFLFQLQ